MEQHMKIVDIEKWAPHVGMFMLELVPLNLLLVAFLKS